MNEDIKIVKCKECKGTGTAEIISCDQSSSMCCGGCIKDVECVECSGTGEIEQYIED